MVLTDEQRQLVSKNHNLIYQFAKVKQLDLEEHYGTLAIGLCRAASLFDPGRGVKFSTFAWKCMETEYAHYLKHLHGAKHVPEHLVLSYDVQLISNRGTEGATFLDVITSRHYHQRFDHTAAEVQSFRRSLSERQQTVFDLMMSGYRADVIAQQVGCSRQHVSKFKKELQQSWRCFSAA